VGFWKKIGKPVLEWAEHLHLLAVIATHWNVIVSIFFAIGAGFWTWSAEHAYLPVLLVGLGTFVAAIWGINGIIWLRGQTRPSKARLTFDYAYGLTLDEISPSHDEGNQNNNLEFRFQIRNVAPGPLKYKSERIDVIIGDRIKTARDICGILPRNSWVQLKVGGFEKNTVDDFKERTSGTYEYSIIYGHPDDNYSRQTKKRIHFDLVKEKGKVIGCPWIILEESDQPIKGG
jgi:hypothetical protein